LTDIYLFFFRFKLYQDYQAMVAQLEHQFLLGRLSVQGLWFFCQVLIFPSLLYVCSIINDHYFLQYDLIGKLRSMKRYFLLDQVDISSGDYLVHFMDISRDELAKRPEEISVEKLQSLLDLALRSTAAASDPCHEELTCCVERVSLLKRLSTLKDLDSTEPSEGNRPPDSDPQSELLSITGLETFCLSYKVLFTFSQLIPFIYELTLETKIIMLVISGSMAIITNYSKKSSNKIPVDFPSPVPLQTRKPSTLHGLASTSSMIASLFFWMICLNHSYPLHWINQ
ncbi:hypothetical protein BHM03_00058336, partial [Ensete ventricosum]